MSYKRCHRSRKIQLISLIAVTLCFLIYALQNSTSGIDHDFAKRDSIIKYMERELQEALMEDKGTGCNIPKLDPFSPEITKLERNYPKLKCDGQDWVKCYFSECKVIQEVLNTTKDVKCWYEDIIHLSDQEDPKLGPRILVIGDAVYVLDKSDHVRVSCTGTDLRRLDSSPVKWSGYGVGFRKSVVTKTPPPGRENTFNVVFLGFDSTSRHGFIRKMPKSYKYLTETMNATVLEGYNIIGDGTPAALFPILTGKNELEYPDVRKVKSKETLDFMPLIFYKLKDDGYRTAYFEDMPWIGTFQYRFNGFKHQPADHYLRALYLMESNKGKKWGSKPTRYCFGAMPRFKLMLNITDQFLERKGKHFCFTFIADITHDDFNYIATSDDDVELFLKDFIEKGRHENTMFILMGDHGSRFSKGRNTLHGKLEERLPMMAILLPEELKRVRPEAQENLEANAKVLTNPHDIHATVLDVMDMRQHWNPYKVPGADLKRGLTLLEPITSSRSCSEAGIEPHWCTCVSWKNVSVTDPFYEKTAAKFLHYINSLTEPVRLSCVPRTLLSIEWVTRQQHNTKLLKFTNSKDTDGYIGDFTSNNKPTKETFQIKLVVAPGRGVYEASMTYHHKDGKFEINERDISRINAYGSEPSCISKTHPHLNMYCYCSDLEERTSLTS